jgi:hypothetical protein
MKAGYCLSPRKWRATPTQIRRSRLRGAEELGLRGALEESEGLIVVAGLDPGAELDAVAALVVDGASGPYPRP